MEYHSWEYVKDGPHQEADKRAFTFNADVWAGTNNFFLPTPDGRVLVQFQIINDGQYRTDVISEVTFFPVRSDEWVGHVVTRDKNRDLLQTN